LWSKRQPLLWSLNQPSTFSLKVDHAFLERVDLDRWASVLTAPYRQVRRSPVRQEIDAQVDRFGGTFFVRLVNGVNGVNHILQLSYMRDFL
jgi:hypothetical protein